MPHRSSHLTAGRGYAPLVKSYFGQLLLVDYVPSVVPSPRPPHDRYRGYAPLIMLGRCRPSPSPSACSIRCIRRSTTIDLGR